MLVTCPLCSEDLNLDRPLQHSVEIFACNGCMNPLLLRSGSGTFDLEPVPDYGDTRMILQEESISGRLIGSVREALDKLPVLPEVSVRVMELTEDEDSSIQDLAELVAEDPVIASKLIQVANSAYYRGLSEISDISTACARLGMRTVANTVQSVALNNVFASGSSAFTETMRALWRHSVAVAHLSSEISVLQSIMGSEKMYLAGLIHDIGKIAIIASVANDDNEAIHELRENDELYRELIGRFHCLVGLHVALRWGIPADLCAVVFYHHSAEDVPLPETKKMAHVVRLADAVAHMTGFPSERAVDVSLITHPSASYFSMSDVKLASLRVDLEDRMDSFIGAIAS